MKSLVILSGAIGLAMSSFSASAEEVESVTWTRATAESGKFSVETPCSLEEIEGLAGMSGGPVAPPSDGRVMCRHKGTLFMATIRTAPLPEGYDGPSAFDMMLAMGKSDIESSETIVVKEVDGRRAISNQEINDGKLARTNVIELSPNAMLMLVAGGPFEPGYSVEEIEPMVDRFVNSLEISE